MLQVRENEISLRKRYGGTAQLRTMEGTLNAARHHWRFVTSRTTSILHIFRMRSDDWSQLRFQEHLCKVSTVTEAIRIHSTKTSFAYYSTASTVL